MRCWCCGSALTCPKCRSPGRCASSEIGVAPTGTGQLVPRGSARGSAGADRLDVELDGDELDHELLLHLDRCSRCRDVVNALGTLKRRVNAVLGEAAADVGVAGLLMSPCDVASDGGAPLQTAELTGAHGIGADVDADRVMVELYNAHYRSLVRLTILLVDDVETAEEIVQDSFVALHGGWPRLQESEKALSYLRQSIVNQSRTVLGHRLAVGRNTPKPPRDKPSAEHGAIALLERSAVIAALRTLRARQREALVLRFYAGMSEAEIAEAMQISRAAVKSDTAKAMATLRTVLETEP